ncbi:unnamed protein product [Linum trigynum]|uniref:Uncharacterized protein n=1 Tax=Linum trigynum TaxID=586398 RepID=A0AAV2FDH8_9ROSI
MQAQFGISQLILANERLLDDLGDRETKILKLEEQLKEGREGFRQELRDEILKEHEAALKVKDVELQTAREDLAKSARELEGVQQKVREVSEREKGLQDKVNELEARVVDLEARRELELDEAREDARASFFDSDEFKAVDEAKYQKLLRDTVASIRHLFRREHSYVVWDRNAVWDAVEFWGDHDVNSEVETQPAAAATTIGEEVNQPAPTEGGSS